ncbi:MAG: OmpA family protein [Epsilonproteobacteria bacterium]|nr:OmpA family protein [Campylobacterota bacterium]
MKSKLFYTQLFGMLLLLLLLLLVVPKYSKVIPKTLTSRVETALQNSGISWTSIRAEGRDITLSGVAPTIEAHKRAVKLAKGVGGVRMVHDKISPMLISPYRMDMSYNGKEITLSGYMPSKEHKKSLLTTLGSIYKAKNIVDKVDIGAGEPLGWREFITTVAMQVVHLEIASVNIVDKELHISGKIETEEKKQLIGNALEKFKQNEYVINNHIVAMDASAKLCQERFNTLLSHGKIKFESGKSILKPENSKLLNELSDTALLCPQVKIEVIGHTDSLGNDEKNLELSLERAKVVVAKLFGKGISLERMEAKGRGEKSPIANNTTDEGRAKNRRIEFKVVEN